MTSLPIKLPLDQMQTKWKSQIDPVLSNPILSGQQLSGILLQNGTTIVNHGLQRNLQGWFLVGINGASTIYDNQASNQTPNLTLSLTSSAPVTVNLWVY